ncbi:MAG: aminotransferase class III-fold pyridoxal phosphate-dependent enzyme [Sphingopyxis sp.]|nr:aminotransferase class III-fold pyridoxal phosphate-dependent enzyme [Sphingopyxis sp.]
MTSAIDLSHYWMPFTDNRYFKSHPRLLAAAEDMHYSTPAGDPILDATAGLWCVNAGHARRPIVDAIARQAGILDYGPSFQLGHPLAFEAARRVAELMPAGLDRIFLTDSGSESADTALKIALAFHRARGEGQRTRMIGRARGYHGTNFGGMSVGGIGGNRRHFGSHLGGVDHLADTHGQGPRFQRGQPQGNADPAAELEAKIALHGFDQIAAVIVEPVAGSTGVLVPPHGYLERLREITRAHGILLIFDEVITAFGRLGRATAADYFGVVPDILTMAKGINNGSVPMGAVAVERRIHDAIVADDAPGGIEFAHGYTYSGHPLAMAAAIATLDLYRDERLFERAARLSPIFEGAVHGLADAPHVVDVRNLGMMAAIELAPRAGVPGARGADVFRHCFDAGLLIRVTGDIIALSPPLIVSEEQIGEIARGIKSALEQVG